MPEGHSVHRLARSLHRSFAGDVVRASSPQGRFASGAEILDGRVLERADAWGKHLFLEAEGDLVVHVQHSEEREFYSLERLWRDCPTIELPAEVHLASRSATS